MTSCALSVMSRTEEGGVLKWIGEMMSEADGTDALRAAALRVGILMIEGDRFIETPRKSTLLYECSPSNRYGMLQSSLRSSKSKKESSHHLSAAFSFYKREYFGGTSVYGKVERLSAIVEKMISNTTQIIHRPPYFNRFAPSALLSPIPKNEQQTASRGSGASEAPVLYSYQSAFQHFAPFDLFAKASNGSVLPNQTNVGSKNSIINNALSLVSSNNMPTTLFVYDTRSATDPPLSRSFVPSATSAAFQYLSPCSVNITMNANEGQLFLHSYFVYLCRGDYLRFRTKKFLQNRFASILSSSPSSWIIPSKIKQTITRSIDAIFGTQKKAKDNTGVSSSDEQNRSTATSASSTSQSSPNGAAGAENGNEPNVSTDKPNLSPMSISSTSSEAEPSLPFSYEMIDTLMLGAVGGLSRLVQTQLSLKCVSESSLLARLIEMVGAGGGGDVSLVVPFYSEVNCNNDLFEKRRLTVPKEMDENTSDLINTEILKEKPSNTISNVSSPSHSPPSLAITPIQSTEETAKPMDDPLEENHDEKSALVDSEAEGTDNNIISSTTSPGSKEQVSLKPCPSSSSPLSLHSSLASIAEDEAILMKANAEWKLAQSVLGSASILLCTSFFGGGGLTRVEMIERGALESGLALLAQILREWSYPMKGIGAKAANDKCNRDIGKEKRMEIEIRAIQKQPGEDVENENELISGTYASFNSEDNSPVVQPSTVKNASMAPFNGVPAHYSRKITLKMPLFRWIKTCYSFSLASKMLLSSVTTKSPLNRFTSYRQSSLSTLKEARLSETLEANASRVHPFITRRSLFQVRDVVLVLTMVWNIMQGEGKRGMRVFVMGNGLRILSAIVEQAEFLSDEVLRQKEWRNVIRNKEKDRKALMHKLIAHWKKNGMNVKEEMRKMKRNENEERIKEQEQSQLWNEMFESELECLFIAMWMIGTILDEFVESSMFLTVFGIASKLKQSVRTAISFVSHLVTCYPLAFSSNSASTSASSSSSSSSSTSSSSSMSSSSSSSSRSSQIFPGISLPPAALRLPTSCLSAAVHSVTSSWLSPRPPRMIAGCRNEKKNREFLMRLNKEYYRINRAKKQKEKMTKLMFSVNSFKRNASDTSETNKQNESNTFGIDNDANYYENCEEVLMVCDSDSDSCSENDGEFDADGKKNEQACTERGNGWGREASDEEWCCVDEGRWSDRQCEMSEECMWRKIEDRYDHLQYQEQVQESALITDDISARLQKELSKLRKKKEKKKEQLKVKNESPSEVVECEKVKGKVCWCCGSLETNGDLSTSFEQTKNSSVANHGSKASSISAVSFSPQVGMNQYLRQIEEAQQQNQNFYPLHLTQMTFREAPLLQKSSSVVPLHTCALIAAFRLLLATNRICSSASSFCLIKSDEIQNFESCRHPLSFCSLPNIHPSYPSQNELYSSKRSLFALSFHRSS